MFDFVYHMLITSGLSTREEFVRGVVQRLTEIRNRLKKPFLTVAFHVTENADMTSVMNQIRQKSREVGIPCYTSMERMVAAVRRLYAYLRRRDGQDVGQS